MKRKIFGAILIALGVAMLIAALGISGYYLWKQERSGDKAEQVMEVLLQQICTTSPTVEPQPTIPEGEPISPEDPEILIPEVEPDPLRPMPSIEIDGVDYIGYVQIPALELTLPVIQESTQKNLDIAPCRFYGTAYQDNFVIGGHKYRRHFGKLSTLGYGERVIFTDAEGNVFTYEVTECEIIEAYEAEYLCSGDWDLTLYTCTPGGRSRTVVRCVRIP